MTSYRSYEDYDTSANFYDGTRQALGVDIVLGLLAARGPRATANDGDSPMSVLDIGCGTGNYLAALAPHGYRLTGLEYSAGMLAQAREKTRALANVRLVRGSAFILPFPAGRFHAAMLNQVVHHFDNPGDSHDPAAFPMLRQALAQVYETLAPGGLVLLNHCGQQQMMDAYWWVELFPNAMLRMCQRYISLPALRGMLAGIGFEYGGAIVPLDEVLQARDYLNLRGPLDENWRRGDSTWTLATDEELAAGQARLRAMLEDGSAEPWLAGREELRRKTGQTVYLWARRPA